MKLKWMKWVLFLLPFFIYAGECKFACKTLTDPGEPPMPRRYEILYERVLPIISPEQPDPTGNSFTTWNPKLKGRNSNGMIQIDTNKWMAEIVLEDSATEYYIWLNDKKVVQVNWGEAIPVVAERISMRLKGETSWVELKCVEKNGITTDGKWAKFFANKGIQNPSCD